MSISRSITCVGELTDAQLIESFHLQFLQVLTARASDWFALKGGANLRYFFGSLRYSNDIDLDFWGREPWSVGETVDKVLEGAALRRILQVARMEVTTITRPKQTDTTRRWKIAVRRLGDAEAVAEVRTKIEFSGRKRLTGGLEEVVAESVPPKITRLFGQLPPLVPHYTEVAVTEQKIAALASRSETKARDIFDLDLLFRRRQSNPDLRPLDSRYARGAVQRALGVGYASFLSEVLPFLDPDIVELYDESRWIQMRAMVVENLDALANESGEKPS